MSKELYHKIKYHQILMMKKRGYIINEIESNILDKNIDESMSIFDYYYVQEAKRRNILIESLLDNVYKKSNGESLSVIYVKSDLKDTQIKKETFTALAQRILADTINRNILFISRVKWTSEGYKQMYGYPIFNIQFMLHRELIYDPTAHIFQPKFKLLNNDERKFLIKILAAQGVDVLHRICADDPVVKFLGAEPGQIIKIVRGMDYISEVDETLNYRIVVNSFIFEDKKPKTQKAPS